MVLSDQQPNPATLPGIPPYSPMRTVLAVLLAASPPTTIDPRRYQGRSPIAQWRTLTEQHLPPYLPRRIQPPWTPDSTRLAGNTTTVTRSALRWVAILFISQFAGLLLLMIGESLGLVMEYVQHVLLLGMGICFGAGFVQARRLLPARADTPDGAGDDR